MFRKILIPMASAQPKGMVRETHVDEVNATNREAHKGEFPASIGADSSPKQADAC